MPRRRRLTKARVGGLLLDRTHDDEMDLQIGPGARGRTAEGLERLRELWLAHRDELMADEDPGQRPWAWWKWDSGIAGPPPTPTDRNGYAREPNGEPQDAAWLRKHGFLTAFEERALEKRRRPFGNAAPSTIDGDPVLGGAS